jgi:hypothetical protein
MAVATVARDGGGAIREFRAFNPNEAAALRQAFEAGEGLKKQFREALPDKEWFFSLDRPPKLGFDLVERRFNRPQPQRD